MDERESAAALGEQVHGATEFGRKSVTCIDGRELACADNAWVVSLLSAALSATPRRSWNAGPG